MTVFGDGAFREVIRVEVISEVIGWGPDRTGSVSAGEEEETQRRQRALPCTHTQDRPREGPRGGRHPQAGKGSHQKPKPMQLHPGLPPFRTVRK